MTTSSCESVDATVARARRQSYALTSADWQGPPLRVGHLPGAGRLGPVEVAADTVSVWSGGKAEVTVQHRHGDTSARRQSFARYSGTIDLVPAGTTLEQVEWRGQRQSWLSAELSGPGMGLGDHGVHCLDPARGARFGAVDAHIVDVLRRLEAQAVAGQPLGTLYTQALSLTLFSYLRGQGAAEVDAGGLSGAQRARVVEFVEANLERNIGLAELAELTGYSPDHFSRLFKRTLGQPAYQYVLARRIERAKGMLLDRTRPIGDIARACGFSTQAHLCAAFKLRTGITPGTFRRR
jgi:AraC family transcriptional regulator